MFATPGRSYRPHLQFTPILFLIAAFGLLLFGRAMDGGLNHDEHQFLAPGALLAREGLWPYRDYPAFHVPNLTFAYAAIASVTDYYILTAKTFSVGCSVAAMALIVVTAFRTAARDDLFGFMLPVALAIVVFFDPLFIHSSGKTWNHDLPAACMIVALISTATNYRRASVTLAVIAGVATGIAAGTRLTSLPLVMPIGLAPLVYPIPWKRRMTLGGFVAIGVLLGLTPSIWTACVAPHQFYFDNFRFPRLRLLDPADTRAQKTMTWWRKGRFFIKEVVGPSWPLFLAYGLFGMRSAKHWWQQRTAVHFPCALIVAVIPFVFLGCSTPSRYQYQHYYVFVPLMALGIAYGANAVPWKSRSFRGITLTLPVLATILLEVTARDKDRYAWTKEILRPERWFAVRMHVTAMQMREHVQNGKVLTLAPAWPIEAGLRIYPEFATGPFAWRSAHHLAAEKRREFRMVGPDDLPDFLRNDPPAAILTGFETAEVEAPLIRFAAEHAYRVVDFGKGRQLWVAPK